MLNLVGPQHGVAGGYYLTFLFGGFVQTAGRLCRANIRPLVLPPLASPQITISKPSDTKTAKTISPPETFAKRVYDILGTLCSILILNYTAAPFMLLGISPSLRAWGRLGWYGHWMIGGTLAFFYLGGKPFLKGFQVGRMKSAAQGPVSSGAVTPGPLVVPPLDAALKKMEKRID